MRSASSLVRRGLLRYIRYRPITIRKYSLLKVKKWTSFFGRNLWKICVMEASKCIQTLLKFQTNSISIQCNNSNLFFAGSKKINVTVKLRYDPYDVATESVYYDRILILNQICVMFGLHSVIMFFQEHITTPLFMLKIQRIMASLTEFHLRLFSVFVGLKFNFS